MDCLATQRAKDDNGRLLIEKYLSNAWHDPQECSAYCLTRACCALRFGKSRSMLRYKGGQDSRLLMRLCGCLSCRPKAHFELQKWRVQWSWEAFSCRRMSAFKQWEEPDTHTHTQILSSLALQTGEDAAQVSLDRAIKWIDHSTASVNSSSPARTQHTVPLMGNREVRTRGGVKIECGRKYPNHILERHNIGPFNVQMQLSANYKSI